MVYARRSVHNALDHHRHGTLHIPSCLAPWRNGSGRTVVDARMPGDHTRNHVRGTVNMPYTQSPETVAALPTNTVVVRVYTEEWLC